MSFTEPNLTDFFRALHSLGVEIGLGEDGAKPGIGLATGPEAEAHQLRREAGSRAAPRKDADAPRKSQPLGKGPQSNLRSRGPCTVYSRVAVSRRCVAARALTVQAGPGHRDTS